MTREEAIKFLNEQKEFLLKGCFWEETRMNINEAFDMAIEALEADAPDTNVGDTISRQAAIDEVVAWLKDRMTDGKNEKPLTERLKDLPSAQPEQLTVNFAREMDRETIEKLKEGLKNAPVLIMAANDSAQPEQKTGKWISVMEGNAYRDKCDQCLETYPNAYGYNFCSNCGHKMEADDE